MDTKNAIIPAPATAPAIRCEVDWREALATFLNTLSNPRTVKTYETAIREAMEALGVEHVADVTPPLLAEYRGGLVGQLDGRAADRAKLSPATVNLKLAALRQFLNFCRVTGICGLSKDVIAFVLKSPRAEVQKPYDVLNEAERRRLLEAAQNRGPREYALVSLALGAGLRVSELVNVRLGDFVQDEAAIAGGGWWVLVKMGKGRKSRLVPLAPAVMEAVELWVKASKRSLRRKADRETALFSTRQSAGMTPQRAWQLVKALAQEAGIEKPISPHSLRHTMAIETLRAGASPVVVQKMLGHSSLAVTGRYLDHLERADLGKWAFSPV